MSRWHVLDRFFQLTTRWFSLFGEHLETGRGETLEYWRVERADSVVILPLLAGGIVLPEPVYRPGVGAATLDFPGGRIADGQTPADAARAVLRRELGLAGDAEIAGLTALNSEGWPVDSSFSSQRLFGMVAELRTDARLGAACECVPADAAGLAGLERRLSCLQCRAVLREWQLSSRRV